MGADAVLGFESSRPLGADAVLGFESSRVMGADADKKSLSNSRARRSEVSTHES